MKQFIHFKFCIFIILTLCSCSNQAEDDISKQIDAVFQIKNFHPNKKYEPISLFFKGKPILTIGKKIEHLDSTLSFRHDPNGQFQSYSNAIIDYLCFDDNISLSFETPYGYVSGAFYFSADIEHKQIFNVNGSWGFHRNSNSMIEKEAIKFIENQLFPVLKGKFNTEKDWVFEVDKGNYIEYFEINFNEKSLFEWVLNYEIKIL
jgi:hypothetical protein